MDLTLPQQLQKYIESELNYEALYRSMAEIAPTEQAQQVLLKIAESKNDHVKLFQDIYVSITGQSYDPPVYPVKVDQPYKFALRNLILIENRTFREYHTQFMSTENSALKKACYQVGLNKTEHISELMALLIDLPQNT